MKNHVLVIGNMKRFIIFLVVYTIIIAAIVSSVFLLINHLIQLSSNSNMNTLISLAESTLLV